ncbi:hypothetical protein FOE78_01225 [Microlunatus elymi]|uniref:SAF domain-containing protein n=1 Tax=Microlunatus elymi TaxID=2596828 RepID=A0A516PU94_9ACTN|nr:SAF domain-containing protein [Microlunatus elymi]QDP94719.1 hypothetical protein FOE78_01225 [Microlunatus elymi]
MAIDERMPDTSTVPAAVPQLPVGPRVRTRRNPRWIALGIVAICLGALASFFLYSQLSESHQVVAIRHTVTRGTTIGADDLAVVSVGDIGGAQAVPADRLPSLVGQVAAYDLVAGSLLPADATTDNLPPAKSKSVVGIRVAIGRAPSGFLTPGSPIRLVVLPASAAGAGSADSDAAAPPVATAQPASGSDQLPTITAAVVSSERLDDGIYLNIELDARQAIDAAAYAAEDRVVVIRESER